MGGPCTKAASMSFDMDLNTQQLRLTVCTLTSWASFQTEGAIVQNHNNKTGVTVPKLLLLLWFCVL